MVDIGKCSLDLPWNAYYEKELDVRFSRSYGPGRYDPIYEEQRDRLPDRLRPLDRGPQPGVLPGPAGPRAGSSSSRSSRAWCRSTTPSATYEQLQQGRAGRHRLPVRVPGRRSAIDRARCRRPVGRRPQPAVRAGARLRVGLHRRRQLRVHDAAAAPQASATTSTLAHVATASSLSCVTRPAASSASSRPAPTTARCSTTRRSTPSSSSPATTRTPDSCARRCGPARRCSSRSRWPSPRTQLDDVVDDDRARPATTGCRSASTAASRRCSSTLQRARSAGRARSGDGALPRERRDRSTRSSWYARGRRRRARRFVRRGRPLHRHAGVVARRRCRSGSHADALRLARRRRPGHDRLRRRLGRRPSPTRRSGSPRFPKETLERRRGRQGGPPRQLPRGRRCGAGRRRRRWRAGLSVDKGQAAELAAFVDAVRSGGPMPIPLQTLVAVTRRDARRRRRASPGARRSSSASR